MEPSHVYIITNCGIDALEAQLAPSPIHTVSP